MVLEKSNVVALNNNLQADQKDSSVTIRNSIILECREIIHLHFDQILPHLFEKIDDELYALSDKAANSSLQSLYFDAMRYFRKKRHSVKKHYTDSLFAQYDDFWLNKELSSSVTVVKELDQDSFELVENEVLEEDLAITTMVAKGNNRFHRDLFELNTRFAVLANGKKLDKDSNPLAPTHICHAFERALKPLDLELTVKLVIYKLFENLVVSNLDIAYKKLNATLIKRGILPKISRQAGHTHAPAPTANKREGNAPNATPNQSNSGFYNAHEQNDEASLEAFHGLQSLLEDWRSQLGIKSLTNGNIGGLNNVQSYQSAEVLNTLTQLQQTAPNHIPTTDSNIAEFKVLVTDELKKRISDGKLRSLAEAEEDSIDMVAMIFDFILDSSSLPDAIKALISRLQIPMVKIAILDKGFFAKKNHPARRLLNNLAKAGLGLDKESCKHNPIFAEMERIINRIVSEFDQDIGILGELLDEFLAFMEKDDHRTRIMEKRTQQVTQSTEQLLLAKNKVAGEIARRLQGKIIHSTTRKFLINAWKDVLVLRCLRKDRETGDWKKALAVVDQVLWISDSPVDVNEKNRKLQAISGLMKEIRKGLEMISYDPCEITQILQDLETCQSSSLNEIGNNAVSKSGVENAKLVEETIPLLSPDQQTVNQQEEVPEQFMEQANKMKVGQWLEMTDKNDKKTRIKLSWKSQVTSVCIFVNRKGAKVTEMPLRQLAAELHRGSISTIENPTTPLMDRALSALMKTLQNPNERISAPA